MSIVTGLAVGKNQSGFTGNIQSHGLIFPKTGKMDRFSNERESFHQWVKTESRLFALVLIHTSLPFETSNKMSVVLSL